MADDGQGNDNTCVVCFKNLFFYSIGECDHPVCYECSTRMRVLCQQNECPICRHKLDKVIFTGSVRPYKELHSLSFDNTMFEPQYNIGFCNKEVKKAYEKLLEHRCKPCKNIPPFRNFAALNDHMKKVHERQFCDLCVKNLKIFTFERKCYTRQELAHHRRKGDPDDTSHRGHPLCEFCEERFMDADELYRHLRKEHLYCHLCDADGRNYYYASHDALAHHFRTEHYLCEEGECAGNHLTAVFRSDIDLKAHKANVHGKGLARAAARQARTLELQFNITPHPNAHQQRQGYRDRDRDYREQRSQQAEQPTSPPPQAPAAPRIDPRSDSDFPRLSAAPPPLQLIDRHYNSKSTAGLSRDDRNFPALNGGGGGGGGSGSGPSRSNGAGPAPKPPPPVSATIVKHSKPSLSIQLQSQPASASNFRLTQPKGQGITLPQQPRRNVFEDDDFPTLSVGRDDYPSLGVGTVQPSKVALVNQQEMDALKKTKAPPQQKKLVSNSAEAFPALSSASAPTAPPQWIKVTKTKDKGKAKQEPPPKPKKSEFNPVADFPTLPVNNTKPKKQTPPPPPQQNTQTTKPSKKEKKKQNETKKENLTNYNDVNSSNDKKNAWDSSVLTPVNNNGPVTSSQSKKQQDSQKGNGDFNYTPNQYPPLSNSEPQSRPILNGVPPGFSKRPACDGMTFTNSSGQTFPAPLHTFISPPDFENRNRALVKNFAVALGGTEAVEDFKVASRAFRDNIISADEFYHHCEAALGSQLDKVFPELVALLPDIGKQQELVIGRNVCANLSVCSTCGQWLQPEDSIGHDTAHWPSLGAR